MAIYANTVTTTQGYGFPELKIYQGTFNFQYGTNNWATGYTLPQGTGERIWYRIKTNYGDYRWSSEMHVMGASNFFGGHFSTTGGWNTVVCTTGGAITITNANGGNTGNLPAEIRVWVMESARTDWTYGGGA